MNQANAVEFTFILLRLGKQYNLDNVKATGRSRWCCVTRCQAKKFGTRKYHETRKGALYEKIHALKIIFHSGAVLVDYSVLHAPFYIQLWGHLQVSSGRGVVLVVMSSRTSAPEATWGQFRGLRLYTATQRQIRS